MITPKPIRLRELAVAGPTRPSLPVSAYAEDFSLLIRNPRRLRIVRGRITVLN